jgi:hypothetical protein
MVPAESSTDAFMPPPPQSMANVVVTAPSLSCRLPVVSVAYRALVEDGVIDAPGDPDGPDVVFRLPPIPLGLGPALGLPLGLGVVVAGGRLDGAVGRFGAGAAGLRSDGTFPEIDFGIGRTRRYNVRVSRKISTRTAVDVRTRPRSRNRRIRSSRSARRRRRR